MLIKYWPKVALFNVIKGQAKLCQHTDGQCEDVGLYKSLNDLQWSFKVTQRVVNADTFKLSIISTSQHSWCHSHVQDCICRSPMVVITIYRRAYSYIVKDVLDDRVLGNVNSSFALSKKLYVDWEMMRVLHSFLHSWTVGASMLLGKVGA